MNKLTKNDIILKDGVLEFKKNFELHPITKIFPHCIYEFYIPILDIHIKIKGANVYGGDIFYLPKKHSKVTSWDYFINYFDLGVLDNRIKNVYVERDYYLKNEEFKFIDNKIICCVINFDGEYAKRWKLFVEIENPYLLSFQNFNKNEFWDMNDKHPLNSNNILKKFTKRKKQVSYLLKDKNTGYYKIGKSINPLKREKTLQSEKPSLILVKKFKNNWEKHLHNKYKSQRVRGEYFNLNKIQLKYICTHYE